MSLPKVLIISQPFNNDTGGGVTLTNLFLGWPSDKLAVVCTGYVLEFNVDTTICRNIYQLGHKEDKWVFPFSLIKRKYASGPLKLSEKRIQNFSIPNKSKVRAKLIMEYMWPFLRFLNLSQIVKKTILSNDLRKWLDEFKPDVIYAQAEDRMRVAFCLEVQAYLNKPMVYHIMDDWQEVIANGLFKRYWYKKVDAALRVLFKRSSLLMSICDEMSIEYKHRYNEEFIPFHNPVELDFWKPYQKKNYDLSNSPTLLYAGRIGLGIDSSLKTIAKAIDQVNKELNMSAKFVLQTQPGEKPEWLADYKCVQHQSFVPYEDLPKVLSSADFMVLPYDFAEEPLKYIRLSMPTKASEYMISGTPIIVFAPQETAIVEYAKKGGWAKVIVENEVEVVVKAVKQLFQNKDERRRIAQNAIQVAERNHDSRKISRSFQDAICSLTQNVEVNSLKNA
jgi:glycosyltransferase involved in cell wall biosynthesis